MYGNICCALGDDIALTLADVIVMVHFTIRPFNNDL